jgi:hypothetical protein
MLTTGLIRLLEDAVPTAQTEPGLAGYAGVLLHAADVEEGGEPGRKRSLVGTSTNGVAIGHCWVDGSGDLRPTLVPIQYVQTLRAALPKLLTKDNKQNHVTELWRDGAELVIREEPDLFDTGWGVRFSFGDLDDWPRDVFGLLASVHLASATTWKRVENRTDFPSKRLAPFLAIAGRHGGNLSLYRVHQGANVHVQIGSSYRGLLVPAAGWNESSSADGDAPDIGVYAPDLPVVSRQAPTSPAFASV